MKTLCSLRQRYTMSSKEAIAMRSTRKPSLQTISYETFVTYINGYESVRMGASKSKSLLAMLELKHYISLRGLEKSSWSSILYQYSVEDNQDFPFTKSEWLDLWQIKSEKMAFLKLIQFINQTITS